MSLLLFYLFD